MHRDITAPAISRRQLMLCASGLALAAACLFGIHWWNTARFMVETDNAYVQADMVTISPFIAGNIVAVEVADNQPIRAGDVLARIDDRDYRMKVAQDEGAVTAAQADIAAQQARLANLQAQTAQQQNIIAGDEAAIAASQADAQFRQMEYQRQLTLVHQQAVSTESMQAAQAASQKADAALQQDRAALAAARDALLILATSHDEAAADLDKSRGMLAETQAALDQAHLYLGRTAIRAPVSGVVGQRSVRAGQYADTGMPLMAIVPDNAYIVANYKETQTNHIRPGQRVKISVDAFGGAVLNGHVESFAPASGAEFAVLPPDNATGNFTKIVQRLPLRIELDPNQPRAAELRPGMSVETIIDTRP